MIPKVPRRDRRLSKDVVTTIDVYNKYVEKGGKLAYFAFRDLIFAYQKAMIDECISTGNDWWFRGGLGVLQIARVKRKFKVKEDGTLNAAIDWGATNKLKKDIIAKGGTPLEVYKNEKGEKIGDNGGTPYLCYHTSSDYYIWRFSNNLFLKNGHKYKFDASRGNSKKLSAAINDNSPFIYKVITDSEK